MEMLKVYLLFILSFIADINGNAVERDILDTTHGWGQCAGFDRSTGDWWGTTCTCKTMYTTMMSNQSQEYTCRTISEVGCDYNLQHNTQVYLITTRNDQKVLIDLFYTPGQPKIKNISTWDYNLYTGSWINVTAFGLDFFSVEKETVFTVRNLDLDIWGGHVIKIDFDDNRCLLVKVKGGTKYPLTEDVKGRFVKRPPTEKPTTRKPKTTTPKTTAPKTTAPKTTTARKTTEPTTVTKRGKSATTEAMLKPETTKLPVVTPSMPARQTGSQSKKTIIVLLSIAAVIILSLIAAIIYKRHKSKSETIHHHDDKTQQQQQPITDVKVPNMYPDVSMVNNSYEPAAEYYTAEMTTVNNDTVFGEAIYDMVEGCSNETKETSQDTNTNGSAVVIVDAGDCGGIENPSYMCQVDNIYVDIDDNSENVDETNDNNTTTTKSQSES